MRALDMVKTSKGDITDSIDGAVLEKAKAK